MTKDRKKNQKEILDSAYNTMYNFIMQERCIIAEKLDREQYNLALENGREAKEVTKYVKELEKTPKMLSELEKRINKVKGLEPKEKMQELVEIVAKLEDVIQIYRLDPDPSYGYRDNAEICEQKYNFMKGLKSLKDDYNDAK